MCPFDGAKIEIDTGGKRIAWQHLHVAHLQQCPRPQLVIIDHVIVYDRGGTGAEAHED